MILKMKLTTPDHIAYFLVHSLAHSLYLATSVLYSLNNQSEMSIKLCQPIRDEYSMILCQPIRDEYLPVKLWCVDDGLADRMNFNVAVNVVHDDGVAQRV